MKQIIQVLSGDRSMWGLLKIRNLFSVCLF